VRRTQSLRRVAAALLSRPDAHHWGYQLIQETGLASGALYPILARLEAQGWLASDWADPDGSYPRRRYYTITSSGREALTDLLRERQT
jgi:PadR family transcriptional regulator PadR